MGGRDKLAEMVAGEPILQRVTRLALAVSPAVLVTLPPDGPFAASRRALLSDLDAAVEEIPDAAEGMAASLRAGARMAAAQGADGVMILLPDMPEIDLDDLALILAAFAEDPARVVRGASGERAGHPVVLPASLFGAVGGLRGDEGARGLPGAKDWRRVALPGRHAITDLDTADDWSAWRAATRL